VLGAPVGSDEYQTAFVSDSFAKAAKAAALLPALDNKQAALLLLRYGVASRPVMLLRTVPPPCTEAPAAKFDESTRHTLASLLRLPSLSDESWLQATLPLRPGLGLPLAHATREPAFAASWAHFAALAPSFFPQLSPCLQQPEFESSRLGLAVASAQQLLKAAAPALAVPLPSRGDLIANLQHKMASISTTARRQQLAARGSLATQARLLCGSAKGSSAWLTAIPSVPELRMGNTAFCVSVASLLGAPLPLALPSRCVCGEAVDSLGVHLANCHHVGGAILRHDRVIDLLQLLAHAAGVPTVKEACHWVEDNSRLDLVLVGYGPGGRDVALDVKIVNPLALGALRAGSHSVPLATATAGEAQKTRDYGPLCTRAGMEFNPMVWEAIGGAGSRTLPFLKALISRVENFVPSNWAASSPSSYWLQRFAVTIQHYTASKIMHLAEVARQSRQLRPASASQH
jgi:hypothetical protein